MDPRVQKLAQVMVNYSLELQPGALVWLFYEPLAEPLGYACYEEVLKAGGHPVVHRMPGHFAEILLKHGSSEQITFVNPLTKWLMENANARIRIRAPENTKELSNIDPTRIAQWTGAQADIMQTFMERSASGELPWVLTQYPTAAAAQDADMSLSDYEDFVYGSIMLHLDDPVAYWQQKSIEQQRLVDWLNGKKFIEVKGDNIDLSLSIEGRTFLNSRGLKNLPDGEIFTGPVEDSVNGWVRFTYPAVYQQREVDGVELHFENGKVVQATAEKGEDYLLSVLDTDPGSRYLGEFAIGTNEGITDFSRNILFDEKMNGTVHMAIGAGYPETGNTNKSAIHWDMICDMRSGGEIIVDGELFYKNGEFQV